MHKNSFYIINTITVYRLIAAPILVFLIYNNNLDLFKWLLPLSFFTDLIDGYLARKFYATSIFGSRLDSIADDMTIVAATIGLFVFKKEFINNNIEIIIILLSLFIIQTILALVKYHKITSFHTYLAKTSALFQGSFLILIFILPEPIYILFYLTAIFTTLDLAEEIILVFIIPKWKANVKGLYWVLKKNKVSE